MLNVREYKAVIEGLLFVAGDEGLSITDIANVLELEEKEVSSLLKEMKQEYEDESRGIELAIIAGRYQFTTKPMHAHYYRKLIQTPGHSGLSQAALETLAIIAYNQPITRADIEEIRGVKSEKAIATLVSKLLVQDVGRAEGSGRAILYGTTNEFLDYFGLSSIADLPSLPENEGDELLEDPDLFYKNFEKSINELFTKDNQEK